MAVKADGPLNTMIRRANECGSVGTRRLPPRSWVSLGLNKATIWHTGTCQRYPEPQSDPRA